MNMDPVYRYMMPYPYPRDHMDYRPNHYPISPAAPSHMYMTPTRPPVNYEHWPWGSNYSYPYPPVGCHGCCNHSHMPAHYSWRPPYSHVPPAYAPGSYPPYPGEYMPPYYHMEQPQFAYEKNMPKDHHCCGCPNHLCSQKEKNVKIEEEEPERELNKDATLSPFNSKNSPYPLMWLPVDSGNNSEHQKNLKDGSMDVKPIHDGRKTDEKRPGAWFGWSPFESNITTGNNGRNMLSADAKIEKSGPAKEQEEKRISSLESDGGKGRPPFPLFWIPYMPEENVKEESKGGNVTDSETCLEPVKDSGQQIGGHAISKVKEVPVKEVKPHEESAISQSKEGGRHSSFGDGNGSREKLSNDDQKREPSSPPKSSKLPPVCLRVEPLPRRKSTNGKSRSLSPPHDKQKLDKLSNGVRKVLSSTNHGEKKPDLEESKEGKGTIKAIKVVDAQDGCSKNQIEVELRKENVSTECRESGEAVRPENTLSARGEKEHISSDKEVVAHEVKEPSRPKISDEQAAVIIQSAYRGFVIRRWEPVKKLKQIAKVREKMAEVNASIQSMESSPDVLGDGKQMTIIAETIMGLLLELDMIQGLHPSIREVRKSVVRELVTLQEKLDALINEKPVASEGQQLVIRCDENASKETDGICSQNLSETRLDMVEAYPLTQLDGKSPEASEMSEQPAEEPEVISENKATETESCITEESETAAELTFGEEEEVSRTDGSLVTKGYNESHVLGQDTECYSVSSDGMIDSLANNDEPQHEDTKCFFQQNSSSDEMIDYLANGDEPQHESIELPEEVSDDYCPSYVGELDQVKQQERGPTEENSSELNHEDQLGESINSHVTETKPQNEYMEDKDLSDELGTTKQVEKATETVSLEPDKIFDHSPRSVFTSMFESPEAHDETEYPFVKTSNGGEAYSHMPQEGSRIMEEEEVMLPEKEFDVDQETGKESPHTDAAAAILEEERMRSVDYIIVDQCSEEATGNAFDEEKQPTECEQQQVSNDVKFAHQVDNTPEIMSVADGQMIDTNMDPVLTMPVKAERGEKLIEENERLRDMVEKLVKSGEEQLRVISSLSGRVKDLEKNLSKKRKVKVKPAHRGKRSGYLNEWTEGVTV